MCHPNVLDVCSSRESFNSFGGISRSRWDCRLVCAILMYWTCVLLGNPFNSFGGISRSRVGIVD